ncbi:hypothetical protein Q5P01_009875 [Channa striata]|uniref:Uncharacterized protein n=1 Tax=Channa striata TaxID=64152 RepID=A0AA88MZR5_CHASR|nr:hypothetical protein Q5P01_009875 [Channa striata]
MKQDTEKRQDRRKARETSPAIRLMWLHPGDHQLTKKTGESETDIRQKPQISHASPHQREDERTMDGAGEGRWSGRISARRINKRRDEIRVLPVLPLSMQSFQLHLTILLPLVVISALPVSLALAVMSEAEVRGRKDQIFEMEWGSHGFGLTSLVAPEIYPVSSQDPYP